MAYTVRPGDSLWAIAERELGSGARWQEIQRANNISGTLIFTGQQLNIPGQQPAATGAPTPPPAPAPTARPPAASTVPPAPAPTARPPAASTVPTIGSIPGAGTVTEADRQRRAEELLRRDEERDALAGLPIDTVLPGSPGSQAPVPQGPQFDRESARSIIQRILEQYGLENLADTVMGAITSAEQLTEDRLMATIRSTPQYQERFRGNELRRAAGLNVLGEGEYVAVERAYADIMRSAGLPSGFYDQPSDFAQLIGGGVSVAELSQRITVGYRSVADADPTVRDQMRMMYGLTDGELAAYFLDPDRALPVIERQVATARLGAAAARQGFGETVDTMAFERMVALGVTEEQATETFGTIAQARELLQPIEAGETALDVTETALGLLGQSPEALQRLRTQQRRRQARFEGGGMLAQTGQGVTGLRQA